MDNNLVNAIQQILMTGELTPEEEQQIETLLWKTPVTNTTFTALSRLEQGLTTGKVAMVCRLHS